MSLRAKILSGILALALALGAVAFAQERRQEAILEGVRASLAVGDTREKVERVLREHGLQPELSADGNSYTAHVWFHFRPDVALIIALNGPVVSRLALEEIE